MIRPREPPDSNEGALRWTADNTKMTESELCVRRTHGGKRW